MASDITELFKETYNKIDKDHIDCVHDLYSDDIVFMDPFHNLEGIKNVKSYFADLYENVNHINFDFGDSIINGQTACINWRMSVSHSRLSNGETIVVDGITQIRFNENKVFFHRDYFDGGSLLYEHVPLLGTAIRALKRRMQ